MNRVSILIGMLVLIGGITTYLLLTKNTEDTDTQAATQVELAESIPTADTKPQAGTGSLRSLLASQTPLECTITFTPEESTKEVTGTFFTADGLLRGDFVLPELGAADVSSMILRDETLYTWSVIEGEEYGMKINLADVSKDDSSQPSTNEPVPLDAAVAYTCLPWKAIDRSVFEPPTTVLFQDFGEVVNRGMEYGTVYDEVPVTTSGPCALCEQVESSDGQAECKAQFKCQ
jgi:hypothetical protein